jgi:hypothetical protein
MAKVVIGEFLVITGKPAEAASIIEMETLSGRSAISRALWSRTQSAEHWAQQKQHSTTESGAFRQV